MEASHKLFQYVLILGAGIVKDESKQILIPQFSLEQRLKKGTEEQQVKIICCGKGKNPIGVESQVMKQYLLDSLKVEQQHILTEEWSLTTIENSIFSFFLLFKLHQQFKDGNISCFTLSIVTSEFHVERTQLIFNQVYQQLKHKYPQLNVNFQYFSSTSLNPNLDEHHKFDSIETRIKTILNLQFNESNFRRDRNMSNEDFTLFKNKFLKISDDDAFVGQNK